MSLIGKITGGVVVGAELIDSIRYSPTSIESLGIRPDYGEDGTGWVIMPIPEEPVDPGKLEFGIGLSPVVIFGKDEICVGVNAGIGYEVKFLACHRSEPVKEPGLVLAPSPTSLDGPPTFPVIPDIPLSQSVSVLVNYLIIETREYLWPNGGGQYVSIQSQQTTAVWAKNFKKANGMSFIGTVEHQQNFYKSVSEGAAKSIFTSDSPEGSESFGKSQNFSVGSNDRLLDHGPSEGNFLGPGIIKFQGTWGQFIAQYKNPEINESDTKNGKRRIGDGFSNYEETQITFADGKTYRQKNYTANTIVVFKESLDDLYFPPPQITIPPEKCQPTMQCCDNKDTQELIRLIARCLGVTNAGHFMELPKSMVLSDSNLFGKTDASETVKIKSQAEFNAYLLKALNEITGQFEVSIDVPARLSKATKGEAERIAGTITIPDIANGMAIITKLLLNLQDDESDMRSFLTRILLETHLGRQSSARAADEAYALRLWTGMKVTEEAATMPCTFSPPRDIAGKDIDQIDTDAEVKDFLRESKVPYKRVKYSDKAGFKEIVHQLLQGVAILRAVFGIRLDPKRSAKDQFKDLVRQTHSNAQGKPLSSPAQPNLSDDDFKDFVKGQAKQRGIEISLVGEKK
jgi:hypothetical protein